MMVSKHTKELYAMFLESDFWRSLSLKKRAKLGVAGDVEPGGQRPAPSGIQGRQTQERLLTVQTDDMDPEMFRPFPDPLFVQIPRSDQKNRTIRGDPMLIPCEPAFDQWPRVTKPRLPHCDGGYLVQLRAPPRLKLINQCASNPFGVWHS